jgi:hypothetical protein
MSLLTKLPSELYDPTAFAGFSLDRERKLHNETVRR